jgi:hypothetical protein
MMNVAIQGTKNFINYNVFMRAMGVALSLMMIMSLMFIVLDLRK